MDSLKAAAGDRLVLAGNVGGGRQLSGITIPDDRFSAASSAGRLSSLDPLLPIVFERRTAGVQRLRPVMG